MAHPLEGVLKPQKRPVGLLLDTAPSLNLTTDRWRAGVTFPAYGSDGLTRGPLAFCADDAFDAPEAAVSGDLASFGAFDIVATEECSTLDVDMAWLSGRLDDRWDAMVSEQVAAELEVGGNATAIDGATPTLVSSAEVVGSGAATTVGAALASIEAGLAAKLHGAVGYIHVSPEVLTLLGGDQIDRDDVTGIWTTYTGHVVISDAGYTGAAPDAGTETSGTRWIYGTGPVAHQLGDPRTPAQPVEGFDMARNRFTARKIAQAIVIFDPATVVAAQVELPDSLGS